MAGRFTRHASVGVQVAELGGIADRERDQRLIAVDVGQVDAVDDAADGVAHLRGRAFPCNVRRERGHSLVMLEGREGIPL